MMRPKSIATVAINLVPQKGSWGGANQWASQLKKYLTFCGYRVVHDLKRPVDCIVMTHSGLSAGTTFLHDDVKSYRRRHPDTPCIQRINDNDIRKGTDRMDALLADANQVADCTVFVSEWLRDYHSQRWFDVSRSHEVISPGADPAVFHPLGHRPPDAGDACRIVTHHWSNNWSKGFDVYQEIDIAIAGGALQGYELWVIGRWPSDLQWKSARTFPPASGGKLAALLRQCHIYVSASRHEPGAMHPVEGIQCGLPIVMHPDTGGTVTQCSPYGVVMDSGIVPAIEELRSRYDHYRKAILSEPPSGDAMCIAYRRLIQKMIVLGRAVPPGAERP